MADKVPCIRALQDFKSLVHGVCGASLLNCAVRCREMQDHPSERQLVPGGEISQRIIEQDDSKLRKYIQASGNSPFHASCFNIHGLSRLSRFTCHFPPSHGIDMLLDGSHSMSTSPALTAWLGLKCLHKVLAASVCIMHACPFGQAV